MLLVIPPTSATHPTSYLSPQPHGYYPRSGCRPHYDTHPFAVPSYQSNLDLFRQPSAEEIEEREYQRALEVIVNHRRRQVEKEAAIRRHQLAEAARRQYFTALAAELEQQHQEELLAARRAEFIRSQQARARLVAAERQQALNAFLLQSKGAQPVCCVHAFVEALILIKFLPQIARQPHVAKRKPLADVLKQRLAAESDADIAEPIKNILSSLESHSVESEEHKAPKEDASKVIETLLSSIFPGLVFRTQPEPSPSAEQTQQGALDKGKGKARSVDVEEPQKPAQKPESANEAFANILRHVMELSKSTPAPRSSDEAGPSGSSSSSSSAKPAVTESEQAQIDRAIALSSIEHVQSALTKLQAGFVLPTELDHYAPSADDQDETASVSSVSSSDLTKFIPYTSTNKPVYKYENELNRLLEELDKIDSHGDAEVREKRKQVVKAIEKALEGVGHVVGEAVEKSLSLVSVTTPAGVEPPKGFDVDEDASEVVVDNVAISEPSTPVSVEEPVTVSVDVPTPADEAVPEADAPTAVETTADLPVEQITPESDVEASTATITPDSVEAKSAAIETEPTEVQVQSSESETVDTFLLPEKVTPPSPVQKPRQSESDSDDEVLVLDSDGEKSDWSELEQ